MNTTQEEKDAIKVEISGTSEQLDAALNKRYIIINETTWCRTDHMADMMKEFIDSQIKAGKLIDPTARAEGAKGGDAYTEALKWYKQGVEDASDNAESIFEDGIEADFHERYADQFTKPDNQQ